ncbi:MAG: PAS domain-containing protein, partial [Acetobacteraceae bacterium]|nr:PAS domain-containing protein [Acetobacteraceae bacterium]
MPARRLGRFPPRPGFGLRTHLGVLVAAALLPALLLGAMVFWDGATAFRRSTEARLAGNARALAQAVARDIRTQQAIVDALADLFEAAAHAPDLGEFDSTARALAAPVDGWVVVADLARSRQLVNTRLPAGAALPPWDPGPASDQVRAAGATGVLNLVTVPLLPGPVLAVVAPVPDAGGSTRVLGLHTLPDRLVALLQQVPLARGGVTTVIDGQGHVIARSLDHARWVGQAVPGWRLDDARRVRIVSARNLDDVAMLAATHPVPGTPDWYVVVAEPRVPFARLDNDAFVKPLAGALGSVALGVALVLWLAGRIVRPVEALERDAAAGPAGRLPRGRRRSGIREIDALAGRIAETRESLRRRAAEAEDQAELMTSVMNAATEPVFAKDLELRFVIANRAATEVMGGSPAALLGKRVVDVADPRVAPVSEANDRKVIATGEPWTGEQDVVTELGRRVFMTT